MASAVRFISLFVVSQILLCVQVLKETLLRHGFTFESETDGDVYKRQETDTEVIPKLAKFVYDKANEAAGNFFY